MFMSSTFTSLHLPSLGLATAAVATELGTNPRTLLVKPVTQPGEAELPGGAKSVIITVPETKTFRQWKQQLRAYRRAASEGLTDPAPSPTPRRLTYSGRIG